MRAPFQFPRESGRLPRRAAQRETLSIRVPVFCSALASTVRYNAVVQQMSTAQSRAEQSQKTRESSSIGTLCVFNWIEANGSRRGAARRVSSISNGTERTRSAAAALQQQHTNNKWNGTERTDTRHICCAFGSSCFSSALCSSATASAFLYPYNTVLYNKITVAHIARHCCIRTHNLQSARLMSRS